MFRLCWPPPAVWVCDTCLCILVSPSSSYCQREHCWTLRGGQDPSGGPDDWSGSHQDWSAARLWGGRKTSPQCTWAVDSNLSTWKHQAVTNQVEALVELKRGAEIQTLNLNIYNTNEVIIQTQRYLFLRNWINKFLEENKIPEHCLKQERWQGLPHIYKVCCPLRWVCVFVCLGME